MLIVPCANEKLISDGKPTATARPLETVEIVVDVNVLLAAHRDDHPHHALVHPWLTDLLAGVEPFLDGGQDHRAVLGRGGGKIEIDRVVGNLRIHG